MKQSKFNTDIDLSLSDFVKKVAKLQSLKASFLTSETKVIEKVYLYGESIVIQERDTKYSITYYNKQDENENVLLDE